MSREKFLSFAVQALDVTKMVLFITAHTAKKMASEGRKEVVKQYGEYQKYRLTTAAKAITGVILHHFPMSGPSRGALLAAKAVGVNVDIQIVDLLKKEQLSEDFVKINPQHTIPTLVDGDTVIWDSHAIAGYLATVYAKDKNLYPQEPRARALIDQRLYFDCGTLYPRIRQICFPVLFLGQDEIFDEHKAPLDEALGFLDVFLEGNDFVTGKHLTIADCCLVASVSSIAAVGWNIRAYSNVSNWLTRCALAIPDYAEANQKGADVFGKAVRSKLAPGQI